MSDETPQLHHRLKLPFFVVCLVSGLAMAIGGVVTGYAGIVVLGGFVALASLPPIWIIVRGRGNPWWMRSPLDPRPGDASAPDARPGDRSATATNGQRAKFWLVLAGSAAFVLAGAALIVVGASRHRPDLLFVGALSCVFFGACAWAAVAVLRGSL